MPSPRSRRGNEADFLASALNRPPRYLGGYFFRRILSLLNHAVYTFSFFASHNMVLRWR